MPPFWQEAVPTGQGPFTFTASPRAQWPRSACLRPLSLSSRKPGFLFSGFALKKRKKKDFQPQMKGSQVAFEDLQDLDDKGESLRKAPSIPKAPLLESLRMYVGVFIIFVAALGTSIPEIENKEL